MFVVSIEMSFIAYREPPSGGYNYPPGTPPKVGGILPSLNPPLQCASTRRTSSMRKLMGWVLRVASAGGVVVVEMQLGVTSKTMRVDWAIHYR